MPKPTTIAASFAALLVSLTFAAGCSPSPKVRVVRIAGIGDCGGEIPPNIVLEVLPGGRLRLNGEDQKRQDLRQRLEDIFKFRYYRYLFVTGAPQVTLGDVVEVIDIAANQVDYVAILTPSVASRHTGLEGACINPNLPADYHGHAGIH
jgi:hypothetical protein